MNATPLTRINRRTSETSLRLSNMRSGFGHKLGFREGRGLREVVQQFSGNGSIRNTCLPTLIRPLGLFPSCRLACVIRLAANWRSLRIVPVQERSCTSYEQQSFDYNW